LNILSTASATKETVLSNLPTTVTDLFRVTMFPALWSAAEECGVNPVGVIAQSAKETGWGSFTGKVKTQFYNTAGIKVRHQDLFPGITTDDNPLAHQMFPNWEVGALAHAQHLLAYCGKKPAGIIVDPRFTLVSAPFVTQWSQLGGRWAPSPTYGSEIQTMIGTLSA
jgi:N-acetylmuramoyl-L-alanine amidase